MNMRRHALCSAALIGLSALAFPGEVAAQGKHGGFGGGHTSARGASSGNHGSAGHQRPAYPKEHMKAPQPAKPRSAPAPRPSTGHHTPAGHPTDRHPKGLTGHPSTASSGGSLRPSNRGGNPVPASPRQPRPGTPLQPRASDRGQQRDQPVRSDRQKGAGSNLAQASQRGKKGPVPPNGGRRENGQKGGRKLDPNNRQRPRPPFTREQAQERMGQLSRCCSGRTQIAINLLSSGILPSAADLADLTSLASSATLEPSDRGLLVCLVRLANEYGGSEDFSTRIMVGVQQYMEEQEQESEGDADEGDTTSFPYTTGVKIKELVEGGAAEQAGLQVEDVILTVNDIKVADSDDILRIVAEANAVEIKVVFLNGENGKVEWMMVRPQAGRFGIGGAAVEFIQD